MKDPTPRGDQFIARIHALERRVAALTTRPAPAPSPTRPDPVAAGAGTTYFDLQLVPPRPIWSDGSRWVDATGTPV